MWVIFDRDEAVSGSRHVGYGSKSGSKITVLACAAMSLRGCAIASQCTRSKRAMWSFGSHQAFRVSVTAHKPETLRPFDNCCAPDRRETPLDTRPSPAPFREPGLIAQRPGKRAVSGATPWGAPAKYQTACATVSAPSSLVSCVCNTVTRPTLVSLRRVRRVMRENVARYGVGTARCGDQRPAGIADAAGRRRTIFKHHL